MSRPFFETWDLAPDLPPDAQRIRDAVDVVEPRRDQGNLQDGFIVESCGPQLCVVLLRNLCGIPGELYHVTQHHAFRLGYRGGRVVALQRFDQAFIQSYPTQKLCV